MSECSKKKQLYTGYLILIGPNFWVRPILTEIDRDELNLANNNSSNNYNVYEFDN